jgi:hypothetical protein
LKLDRLACLFTAQKTFRITPSGHFLSSTFDFSQKVSSFF